APSLGVAPGPGLGHAGAPGGGPAPVGPDLAGAADRRAEAVSRGARGSDAASRSAGAALGGTGSLVLRSPGSESPDWTERPPHRDRGGGPGARGEQRAAGDRAASQAAQADRPPPDRGGAPREGAGRADAGAGAVAGRGAGPAGGVSGHLAVPEQLHAHGRAGGVEERNGDPSQAAAPDRAR